MRERLAAYNTCVSGLPLSVTRGMPQHLYIRVSGAPLHLLNHVNTLRGPQAFGLKPLECFGYAMDALFASAIASSQALEAIVNELDVASARASSKASAAVLAQRPLSPPRPLKRSKGWRGRLLTEDELAAQAAAQRLLTQSELAAAAERRAVIIAERQAAVNAERLAAAAAAREADEEHLRMEETIRRAEEELEHEAEEQARMQFLAAVEADAAFERLAAEAEAAEAEAAEADAAAAAGKAQLAPKAKRDPNRVRGGVKRNFHAALHNVVAPPRKHPVGWRWEPSTASAPKTSSPSAPK
jgi:chemotaxis protein histidine kinase CheA